jgi:hypothetical protein
MQCASNVSGRLNSLIFGIIDSISTGSGFLNDLTYGTIDGVSTVIGTLLAMGAAAVRIDCFTNTSALLAAAPQILFIPSIGGKKVLRILTAPIIPTPASRQTIVPIPPQLIDLQPGALTAAIPVIITEPQVVAIPGAVLPIIS